MAVVYVLANVFVYWKCNSAISAAPLWAKVAVGVVYWVAALSFVAYMYASGNRVLPPRVGHAFYWFSTSWLVFTLYAVLFLLLFMVVGLCGLQVKGQFVWAAGLSLLVMAWGFANFATPDVRRMTLDVSKPAAARSLRVVAVSDVHLGYGVTRERLERFVGMINTERPDVVLIAGDLIDMAVAPLFEEKMYEPLRDIRAPQGIYMVPGNHEYISGIGESVRFVGMTPIVLLRDSVATLPCGIQVVGRDDNYNRGRKPLAELMHGVDGGKPVFVLDHQPNDSEIEAAVSCGADFVLCGHTHKGQVWPMNHLVSALYKHAYGYTKEGGTHVYVSSGLGLWGPPYRIGSDSEMAVIDFHFE